MPVGPELYAWLVELGLIKKPSGKAGSTVLPGKFLVNLVSGEGFVDLLNLCFDQHGVKQRLVAHSGQPRQTWTQVAKGLHRLSVELDEPAIATLASGDQGLVLELLEESCTWCTSTGRLKRRRSRGGRSGVSSRSRGRTPTLELGQRQRIRKTRTPMTRKRRSLLQMSCESKAFERTCASTAPASTTAASTAAAITMAASTMAASRVCESTAATNRTSASTGRGLRMS
ncbi:unnamed protein product [Effrenium voratum]|nr:unnamed protein product [Effrenium voratum]